MTPAGRTRPHSPDVSVVIPTLGSYDTLRRVLDGYSRQSIDAERFELIVVADVAERNPDAVAEVIETSPVPVLLSQGGRPGASANRNRGSHLARAPIVLFTDNDT